MQEFHYRGSMKNLKKIFDDCLDRYYMMVFHHSGIQYLSLGRLIILSYRHERDFWTEKQVGLHCVYLWLSETDHQTQIRYQSYYGLAHPLMIPFVFMANCLFLIVMNPFSMPLNVFAGFFVSVLLLAITAGFSLINPHTEEAEAQIYQFMNRVCAMNGKKR